MQIAATFVDAVEPAQASTPAHGDENGILALPDDVLLEIITSVEVRDILALRMTCQRLAAVTYRRWVWSDALDRHVVARRLPVPAPLADPAASSRAALEARAVHAARFHANWTAEQPFPTHVLTFDATCAIPRATASSAAAAGPDAVAGEDVPLDQSTSNEGSSATQLLFLPGSNGALLATVIADRHVLVWEVPLRGSGAFPVACWSVPAGHTHLEIVANEDAENEGTLVALTFEDSAMRSSIWIHVLHLNHFHGTLLPIRANFIHYLLPGPLWQLAGKRLLLCDPPIVMDWVERATYDPLAGLSIPYGDRGPLLAAGFAGPYLVIVQEYGVAVLGLPHAPPSRHPMTSPEPMERQPYTATLIKFHSPLPGPRVYPHCQLFERDDAPWTFAAILVPEMYKVEGSAGLAGWERHEPITVYARHEESEFPEPHCLIGRTDVYPELRRLQPSDGSHSGGGAAGDERGEGGEQASVRRWRSEAGDQLLVGPSASTLVVRPSGKGIWVETKNVRDRPSDTYGGRARRHPARCIVGFTTYNPPPIPFVRTPRAAERPHARLGGGEAAMERMWRKRKGRSAPHELEGVTRVAARELYQRRCAIGEIVNKRYRLSAVALEDTVGRVAVGSADGHVEVLDFA